MTSCRGEWEWGGGRREQPESKSQTEREKQTEKESYSSKPPVGLRGERLLQLLEVRLACAGLVEAGSGGWKREHGRQKGCSEPVPGTTKTNDALEWYNAAAQGGHTAPQTQSLSESRVP